MTQKKILIVAHPDDEVLFFSSILKNIVSKILPKKIKAVIKSIINKGKS